jgi:tRNA A-37 threonylcarbamoyl transferase component Bud32
MTEASCPAESDLLPLATGEDTAPEVQAHLQTCDACRGRLRQLRAEVTRLRRLAPIAPRQAGVTGSTLEKTTAHFPAASEAPPRDRSHPQAVGRYMVVQELGEGGQAQVYRAVHPTLGRQVVVKLALHATRDDPGARERLLTEGRVLAGLEHPNVARVFDLDFHEGRPFLVMEYVPGRDLEQYARQQRPGPREAAVLVAKLARALAAAHRQGVLHLDVKPRNVLVDEAGEPRLIDFGMARLRQAWGEAGPAGGLGGTPAYTAPEQARGELARVDGRSDVFGLGGVLYFLLTGKSSFTGQSVAEVLDRAGRCDLDLAALRAPGIPRALAAVCRKALAADPEGRYRRAEDMAAALERFADRRKRLLGWGGVIAAVFLTAAVVLAVWLRDPPFPTDPTPALRVERDGFRLSGPVEAIPLRPGDGVRLTCEVPHGYAAGLFWVEADGAVTEEAAFVTRAEPYDRLVYPARGLATLKGPTRTELILVCANRWRKPTRAEVEQALAAAGERPRLPQSVWLALRPDRVEMNPGQKRDPREIREDPGTRAEDWLDGLRRRLRERFAFVAGLAVPFEE